MVVRSLFLSPCVVPIHTPLGPHKSFGIQTVNNCYYKKCNLKKKFSFDKIQKDKTVKILKINLGIDDLSRVLLKDGAGLLNTPTTQLCKL